MKIIAIGWNYPDHNKELDQIELPKEPTLFMKPESALLKENKPFFIPDFSNEIHYELELVIKIDKMGKNIAAKFASRYYSGVALGIDFTARDIQRKQRESGSPWEICKAFDNSAAVSEFIPLSELDNNIHNLSFFLTLNNKRVQAANSSEMIFDPDKIIEYASRFFTLKTGDLIFTGTPCGVGAVKEGDHLEAFLEGKKMLDFYIK